MKRQLKLAFVLIVVLSVLISACGIVDDRMDIGTEMTCEVLPASDCPPKSTQSAEGTLTPEGSELPPGEGIGGGALEVTEVSPTTEATDEDDDDDDPAAPGNIGTAIQQTLEAVPSSTAVQVEVEVTVLVDNPVTITPTLTLSPTITPELSSTPLGLLYTQLANTLTAIVVSSTPLPTRTLRPGETVTVTPTITPTITPIGFVASPTEAPCLEMRFVADITIPDGTIIQPSAFFYKTWRVQNVGRCSWATGFAIVYHSGFQLDGTSPTYLGVRINPGQYVNLTIRLRAQPQGGTFQSNWVLQDEFGNTFGAGTNFDQPLSVEIVVPGSNPDSSSSQFPFPVSTDPGFTPAP